MSAVWKIHARVSSILPYMTCAFQFLTISNWFPVTSGLSVISLRMEEQPPMRRVAANILNRQSQTSDKGWSSSRGLGELLTTHHRKYCHVTKYSQLPRT